MSYCSQERAKMWHGIVLGGRVAGLISKTADAQGSIEFTQNAEEKNKNIQ